MGQKSFSSLHRIDSSMIWNSYITDKDFKWLSYNLWFTYIQYYKIVFFFNYYQNYLINNFTKESTFYKEKKKFINIKKNKIRFMYYIDLYCVDFSKYIFLINI